VQQSSAEVDAIQLDVVRSVRHREARDDRGEEGALAAPRRPGDRQVPSPSREVQDQRGLGLGERLVDDAHRHPQPARLAGTATVVWRTWGATVVRRTRGAILVRRTRGATWSQPAGLLEHLVEEDHRGKRRQPDPVCASVGGRPGGRDDRGQLLGGGGTVGLGEVSVVSRAADRVEGQDERRVAGYGWSTDRRRHRPPLDDQTLEGLAGAIVDPQEAVARSGRQVKGVRDAEHGGGLGGTEGPKADPVAEVTVQPSEPALLEALGGEQQMHPEAAPRAADRGEELEEFRMGGEQLTELVHDHEQCGQRLDASSRGQPPVLGDAVPTGASKLALPPLDLAEKGGPGAFDHAGVVLKVGDQAGGVRQVGQGSERRPALEVHQGEREQLGWVREREPDHDASQQLALAGSGGADQQAMWAHATIRGLLEVEDGLASGTRHRIALGGRDGEADGHPERFGGGQPAPGARKVQLDRGRAQDAEHAEHVEQAGRRLLTIRARARPGTFEPQRGESPRERFREHGARRIRANAVQPAALGTGLAHGERAVVVELDPPADGRRLAGRPVGQPEDRGAQL
jgi:hypothetical protein